MRFLLPALSECPVLSCSSMPGPFLNKPNGNRWLKLFGNFGNCIPAVGMISECWCNQHQVRCCSFCSKPLFCLPGSVVACLHVKRLLLALWSIYISSYIHGCTSSIICNTAEVLQCFWNSFQKLARSGWHIKVLLLKALRSTKSTALSKVPWGLRIFVHITASKPCADSAGLQSNMFVLPV